MPVARSLEVLVAVSEPTATFNPAMVGSTIANNQDLKETIMKKHGLISTSFHRFLIAALFVLGTTSMLAAQDMDWHDWSANYNNGVYNFTNTSSAGTITGSSQNAFWNTPGQFGIPYAITQQNTFTNEFQIGGIGGLHGYADFNFSSGYNWGTGGQMILGNIHNYWEYTVSAWDFNNKPINVNSWQFIQEFIAPPREARAIFPPAALS